jgi:hypothetical protein
MDKHSKAIAPTIGSKHGIYIQGVVISNCARKVTLKDGSIRVSIKHEVALDPGVIVLDRLIDPSLSTETRLDGDEVKTFPKLKKYEQVIVRVQKIKEFNNRVSASDWEIARN